MQVNVRRTMRFVEVSISEGSTTIDLGLLNDSERDEVAVALLDGIVDMGPANNYECESWLRRLLERRGFELPAGV